MEWMQLVQFSMARKDALFSIQSLEYNDFLCRRMDV